MFLDIKNMEYKNVDDEADKKKDSDLQPDEEVRHCMYVCMHCMYVLYVCMYVRMYVCIRVC